MIQTTTSGVYVGIQVQNPPESDRKAERANWTSDDPTINPRCTSPQLVNTEGLAGVSCVEPGGDEDVTRLRVVSSSRVIVIVLSLGTKPATGDTDKALKVAESVQKSLS